PNGGFVVAWDDTGTDGSGRAILERVFDSNGHAVGNEFVVNQFTEADQVKPSVGVSGTEVLTTWTDFGASGPGIFPPVIRGQLISVATSGDFDGDFRSDLLWRSSSGADALWDMNGSGTIKSAFNVQSVDASYKLAGSGDFDGDGIPDLLWRN